MLAGAPVLLAGAAAAGCPPLRVPEPARAAAAARVSCCCTTGDGRRASVGQP